MVGATSWLLEEEEGGRTSAVWYDDNEEEVALSSVTLEVVGGSATPAESEDCG